MTVITIQLGSMSLVQVKQLACLWIKGLLAGCVDIQVCSMPLWHSFSG